jgi:hypothetical protein
MKLGVTGHCNIPPTAIRYVEKEVTRLINRYAPITGLSSLAAGADLLFALSVLKSGNRLHALIPCLKYELTHVAADLSLYQRILIQASKVEVLPFESPCEEAFLRAGHSLVDQADVLIAIWDGEKNEVIGGTASVVAYAREISKPVVVVWPEGSSRTCRPIT